jgi:cation:H+ antiporter
MFAPSAAFVASLVLLVAGATFATRSAAQLSASLGLSKYTVGLLIVAVISILPEGFVAVNSALRGVPSFGLGTLLGSNVADLTLVFALVVLLCGRAVRVQSRILTNNRSYPLLLVLPVTLGWNGHYSRAEGVVLVIIGMLFYYRAFRSGLHQMGSATPGTGRLKHFALLLAGVAMLVAGSNFTIASAVELAGLLRINTAVIGMLLVGLGTTLPELAFAVSAVKKQEDDLAIGDILGTVFADATLLVGVIALIGPFYFPAQIVHVAGGFMIAGSVFLGIFMNSERMLTKREAAALIGFWLAFVAVEITTNQITRGIEP